MFSKFNNEYDKQNKKIVKYEDSMLKKMITQTKSIKSQIETMRYNSYHAYHRRKFKHFDTTQDLKKFTDFYESILDRLQLLDRLERLFGT